MVEKQEPSPGQDGPAAPVRSARRKALPELSAAEIALLSGNAVPNGGSGAAPIAMNHEYPTQSQAGPPPPDTPNDDRQVSSGGEAAIAEEAAGDAPAPVAAMSIWSRASLVVAAASIVIALTSPFWIDRIVPGAGLRGLEQMEQRNRSLQALALSLAANQLRGTVLSGKAYSSDLAVTQQAAGSNLMLAAKLGALGRYADTGAPTLRQIVDGFDGAADDALVAEAMPPSGSWISRTIGRLAAITYVAGRQLPRDLMNSRVAPVIRRATERVEAGDLAGAVTILDRLDGAPRERVAAWVATAEEHLRIVATLDQLSQIASTELAGASP
jgi:hypothetical protein